jgi:hypothetical protein
LLVEELVVMEALTMQGVVEQAAQQVILVQVIKVQRELQEALVKVLHLLAVMEEMALQGL